MLKQYLEPFKDPDHLPHIKNLRIGTRALTFWPQRFTTDPDADSLIELLRDVKEVGGRHIAIMSHLSHYRELSTESAGRDPPPQAGGRHHHPLPVARHGGHQRRR